VFATPGTYTVRQRAINGFGYDDEVKSNVVTVTAPNSGPLNVNLGLAFAAPARVASGTTFTFNVITTNDGLANATNVARVLKLRSNNGVQVTVSSTPPGSTVTFSGPLTIVTLPAVNIASGSNAVAMIQASVAATASAVQLTGTVTSPESDSTPEDNASSLTITVAP
jgi:hypothetical protein